MLYTEKFKNLVLYIISNNNYKEEGIKKLNKILYFVDFYYYRNHEKFISTGIKYAKAGMGPIVDEYKNIFNALVKDDILNKENVDGKIVHKPKINYNISQFSSEEIEHVHNVLDKYGKLSSSDLESISHLQQPWILTEKNGEIIDPDLALLIGDEDEEIEVKENIKNELVHLANTIV
jgi:uncharacterized phage-associated protein